MSLTKDAVIDGKTPVRINVCFPRMRWKGARPAVQFDAELWCPRCNRLHVDEGHWRQDMHHTHQCQHCGHEWRIISASIVTRKPDLSAYFCGVPAFTWRARARTVKHLLADLFTLVLS